MMLTNVSVKMNEKADFMKQRLVEESSQAKERALVAVESAATTARELMSGLQVLDSEIANHYLDRMKFGMAGSDGTRWSNYKLYTANNHGTLSICYADSRNPYSRKRRFMTFWNKMALAFVLSVMFAAFSDHRSFVWELMESAIIASVLTPYGVLLNALARCSFCHKRNVCVGTARSCGTCVLTFFFVLSLINIGFGIFVIFCHEGGTCGLHQTSGMGIFILFFFLSLLLEQLFPLAGDSLNWILSSWSGCLCCPICRCRFPRSLDSVCCCLCKEEEPPSEEDLESALSDDEVVYMCPMKYSCCSILTCFPVKNMMNVYKLAEKTYEEDKRSFREQYPGRIAIDKMSCGVIAIHSEAPAVATEMVNPILHA